MAVFWSCIIIVMGAAQKQGDTSQLDLQHPYLRNCKTRTTANGADLIATVACQLPTYQKWKEELQSFKQSNPNQPFLLLPLNHKFEDGGVCSTSGQLTLEYEYYPRLLSSEILTRKKQNKKFTEGELWYLLYALTMAKFELSQNGEAIGDVQPKNIFINETGQLKMACLRSWPGQVSNYRKAILQQQFGYLAPEDIERLKLGAMDNQVNSQSQIFAMGLVIMSSATLQMNHDLYDMKQREFDDDIFYSRVGKFQHQNTYSQILRGVVSNLLEIDPLKRMNIQQLKAFLQKHSENIIAKKPLRIDNATKKLQKTVKEMFQIIHPQNLSEKDISNKASPAPTPSPPPTIYQPPSPKLNKVQSVTLPIQTNVRQSMRNSHIKNVINYQERRPSSQSRIQLPTQPPINQKIQTNNSRISQLPPNPRIPQPPINNNYFYGRLPPPIPVTINPNMNEQPHRPVINKVFNSSITNSNARRTQSAIQIPKYRPFQSISVSRESFRKDQLKQLLVVNLPNEPSAPSVKQPQTIIQMNPIQQKQILTPITQLQIKQQNANGRSKLSKDVTTELFEHNCLINPNYQPECVDTTPVISNRPSTDPQLLQQAVEEQSQEDEQGKIEERQNQEQESQLSNKNFRIEHYLMSSSRKTQKHSEYGSSLKSNAKISELHHQEINYQHQSRHQQEPQAKYVKQQIVQEQNQVRNIVLQKQQRQIPPNQEQIQVRKSLSQHQGLKEIVLPKEQSIKQQSKQYEAVLSRAEKCQTLVDAFQINKFPANLKAQERQQQKHKQANQQIRQIIKQAKIQVIQFNGNNNKSLSPTVKLWGAKPSTNNNAITLNTTNIKQIQTYLQQNSEKITNKTPNTQNQKDSFKNIQRIIESELVQNKFSNNGIHQMQQNVKVLNGQKDRHESQQKHIQDSNINDELLVNNNYILIQQDSRHTVEGLNSFQNQVQQQRQAILQQESQIINYHTYIEVVTQGNFQDCWQQILNFLKDPTEYSSILDPNKVKIRIEEENWSLKVGPGIFDILLNRQEGKFLLRNCAQQSNCSGEMLGGVYKDEEKRHRIWFNSAYYYNGKKVPSREVIQECLNVCKENIANLKK